MLRSQISAGPARLHSRLTCYPSVRHTRRPHGGVQPVAALVSAAPSAARQRGAHRGGARSRGLSVIVRAADFYDTLGVPRNADKKAIKQAYRSKARKYHPVRRCVDLALVCRCVSLLLAAWLALHAAFALISPVDSTHALTHYVSILSPRVLPPPAAASTFMHVHARRRRPKRLACMHPYLTPPSPCNHPPMQSPPPCNHPHANRRT